MKARRLLVLAVAVGVTGAGLGLYYHGVTPAKEVPNLPFQDGSGRQRTLAEFRGKVVLLNIWATWCAPCREEMPALDRLQAKLGGPEFEVVALSIDGADVSGFARHPLGREADVPLSFVANGNTSRSANALPPGRWNIHLLVRRGESEARLIETLS